MCTDYIAPMGSRTYFCHAFYGLGVSHFQTVAVLLLEGTPPPPPGGVVQRSWRSSCVSAAESEGESGRGASERRRGAHRAACSAREGGSAQAQERPSPGMRSAAILYARCTPSNTHSRCRPARRGRQRRYGGAVHREGARSGGALVTPRRRLRPEGRERLKVRKPCCPGRLARGTMAQPLDVAVAKGGGLRRATGQGRGR